VYAACKIEENHVSAEEIGKGINQDHRIILKYEMAVLQVWYESINLYQLPYVYLSLVFFSLSILLFILY